jgi:hypothetical protein
MYYLKEDEMLTSFRNLPTLYRKPFYLLYRVDKIWGITKHTHIQPVSGGSKILRDFKICGMSSYYLSFPPGSPISRNDVSHREEFLRDWVRENKFMHQCPEGLQKTVFTDPSPEHRYRGGLTTLETRDSFVRRKTMADIVWAMRLSKEICGEEKPWVTDAERDCVASSTQTGSHETL